MNETITAPLWLYPIRMEKSFLTEPIDNKQICEILRSKKRKQNCCKYFGYIMRWEKEVTIAQVCIMMMPQSSCALFDRFFVFSSLTMQNVCIARMNMGTMYVSIGYTLIMHSSTQSTLSREKLLKGQCNSSTMQPHIYEQWGESQV